MSVKIFFCYAREDEAYLNKLKNQLKPLLRQGLIDVWYDRDISAGTEWERRINEHLNEAQIILLLVSPDFMASDYCYSIEMKRALERHDRGDARVIPIILRSSHWREVLGKLQVLPRDGKPVKSWLDQDEAFFDVSDGIRKVVNEIPKYLVPKTAELSIHVEPGKTKDEYINEGKLHHKAKRYKEALAAYNHALELDPNDPYIYGRRADTYRALREYKLALQDFDRAFELNPESATPWAYATRGRVYDGMKEYQNALDDFDRAYRLDPTSPWVNRWRNETKEKLKKQEEKH